MDTESGKESDSLDQQQEKQAKNVELINHENLEDNTSILTLISLT